MPRKVFTPEQIVAALRQIEVAIAQGKSTPMACREAGISDVSYYRWRKEYGGLQLDQAKRDLTGSFRSKLIEARTRKLRFNSCRDKILRLPNSEYRLL